MEIYFALNKYPEAKEAGIKAHNLFKKQNNAEWAEEVKYTLEKNLPPEHQMGLSFD